jgi:hypothetical protein
MLDEKKVQQLDFDFQRICALAVARSTLRQMQNAVLFAVDGDKDAATRILDSLVAGESKLLPKECAAQEGFDAFVKKFSVTLNVAREVAERGEFIGMVTSDIINHPQVPMLGNTIRKISGEECQFLTDVPSTVQLLNHFSFRLEEMDKLEKSKNVLQGMKKELMRLRDQVDRLISSAKD